MYVSKLCACNLFQAHSVPRTLETVIKYSVHLTLFGKLHVFLYVKVFVMCISGYVNYWAMPNAESTSRVAPRVYNVFLSRQHKKMSNTCAYCYLLEWIENNLLNLMNLSWIEFFVKPALSDEFRVIRVNKSPEITLSVKLTFGFHAIRTRKYPRKW